MTFNLWFRDLETVQNKILEILTFLNLRQYNFLIQMLIVKAAKLAISAQSHWPLTLEPLILKFCEKVILTLIPYNFPMHMPLEESAKIDHFSTLKAFELWPNDFKIDEW